MTNEEPANGYTPGGLPTGPARVRWRLDTTIAHPARRYNYWLGGKDNYAADRESGDAIAAEFPTIREAAIENRRFLQRVVSFLTREAGIRQFLDVGTGIPTVHNTHEVAQHIAPESRIVYVDNDPIVLVHARALLTSSPEGVTAYIDADLRNPDAILTDPQLHATLDLSQPVGLLLIAVLQFIADSEDPYGTVNRLVGALPLGSYLGISHPSFDGMPQETVDRLNAINDTSPARFRPRTRDEVSRFLDGLELVEPGVGSITEWRPQQQPRPTATAAETAVYGAVARLP